MSLRIFFSFQYVKCLLKIHKSRQQYAFQDTSDLMNATKTASTPNILHHSLSQTGRTTRICFIISY